VKLSENFYLNEFTNSQTASRLGILNTPNQSQIAKLKALCDNVLQPLRNHVGRPIIITSGYRSPELNRAIKGSQNSQHSHGEAADFTVQGMAPIVTCRLIIKLKLPYDQLIHEVFLTSWVHVSYSPRHRRQTLTINGNGTRNGL
jgi:zinc D-Ala-D-Ala carboxypeptidase